MDWLHVLETTVATVPQIWATRKDWKQLDVVQAFWGGKCQKPRAGHSFSRYSQSRAPGPGVRRWDVLHLPIKVVDPWSSKRLQSAGLLPPLHLIWAFGTEAQASCPSRWSGMPLCQSLRKTCIKPTDVTT